jgi:hypothetical protein
MQYRWSYFRALGFFKVSHNVINLSVDVFVLFMKQFQRGMDAMYADYRPADV